MQWELGSEAEAMVVDEDGVRYEAAGVTHAVDTGSPINRMSGAVLMYARCGIPVRAWPGVAFDPRASTAHAECAER